MDGEDELLELGRPALSRRRRLGMLAAVLALAVAVVVAKWPRPAPSQPAVAVAPTTAATPGPVISAPAPTRRPWPTAPAACGGNVELPIVSSVPVGQATGITLLVGGPRLHSVEFDSGRVAELAHTPARADEFVVGLLATSQTYAVVSTCTSSTSFGGLRLYRVGADRRLRSVPLPDSLSYVIADDTRMWGVRTIDGQRPTGVLVPLDGGRRLQLPTGFLPGAITDGVLVGNVQSASDIGELLLVDAATARVRAHLGDGVSLGVGRGVVAWTAGCDIGSGNPCAVHVRSVRSGPTSTYRLPGAPSFADGVFSPDGLRLAFTIERAAQDPRFDPGYPIPPAEIVILHLDTGVLDVVPGIELPAKDSPGLSFSGDGRWLLAALNAGTRTRVLAWRPGLPHPYESGSIPGPLWGAPAISVL